MTAGLTACASHVSRSCGAGQRYESQRQPRRPRSVSVALWSRKVNPRHGARGLVYLGCCTKQTIAEYKMLSIRFFATLAAMAAVAYSPCLSGQLSWDDRAAVLSNPDVLGLRAFRDVLRHDFWGQPMEAPGSHKSFRPVTVLSLRLDRAFFSFAQHWLTKEINVSVEAVHHLANLLIHTLCSALVAYIAAALGGQYVSYVAGSLFALHPVHTEAVCSIVSRADLLATAFLLLAVCLHVQFCAAFSQRDNPPPRLLYLLLSIPLCIASSFSKESGLMAAPCLVLVDLLLVPRWMLEHRMAEPVATPSKRTKGVSSTPATGQRSPQRSAPRLATPVADVTGSMTPAAVSTQVATPMWARHTPLKDVSDGLIDSLSLPDTGSVSGQYSGMNAVLQHRSVRILWNVFLTAALLSLRLSVSKGAPMYKWSLFENHLAVMPAGILRTLSLAYSHSWYMYLFLWPKDLAYLHGFAQLAPVTSLTTFAAFAGLATWAIVAAAMAVLLVQRDRVRVFFLACALATFLPGSNMFVWIGTVVAERLLYLPSAFLILTVASLAGMRSPHETVKAIDFEIAGPSPVSGVSTARVLVLSGLLLPCGWWSYCRAHDWATELALFERGYAVSPRDMRAANNLAMALLGTEWNSTVERESARERARSLLMHSVIEQPGYQYLAAANLAAISWSEKNITGVLQYGWMAVAASERAGVLDRLPCSVAGTLAAAYLALAQDYGVLDMDAQAGWAVDAGGAPQAGWRRRITSQARAPITLGPALKSALPHANKGSFVSAAGLAHAAAKASIDGGCRSPANLHVSASAMFLLGQETGSADSGVLLPQHVDSAGPGAALFDYLLSLQAAGLGIRSLKAKDREIIGVLVAPEIPPVHPSATLLLDSSSYRAPGTTDVSLPSQLLVQLVALPDQPAQKANPTQTAFAEEAALVPGTSAASAQQTGSTLNMMSTACKALADSLSNEVAAANLVSMADGLARLAIQLQADVPAYRTNVATLWVKAAPTLAVVSGQMDTEVFLRAAAAEAQEAVRLARSAGMEGATLAVYQSNAGFVLEARAAVAEREGASLLDVPGLRHGALAAYEEAYTMAPDHPTIAANRERLRGLLQPR